MRLQELCPTCAVPLIELSRTDILGETYRSYKCGHSFADTAIVVHEAELDFCSADGRFEARQYQKDGVRFGLQAKSCIIGDQMRLGKTPQSLLIVKNLRKTGEPKKVLILVRSANLYQWVREYKTWTDLSLWGIFVIEGSKGFIPPGFSTYIMSMDTFSRPDVSDKLLLFGFDLVIVDEAHSFKNPDSKRSQALIAFLKTINTTELSYDIPFICHFCRHTWNETVTIKVTMEDATKRTYKTSHCEKCFAQVTQSAAAHVKTERRCSVILLTGTVIKNRADEFFVPLNIVAPSVFPSLSRFRNDWLEQDSKGKWSRINHYRLAEFKKVISPFYLRREKEDVYTDLPALNRIFTVVTIEDERLKKAYNAVLDRLEQDIEDNPNFSFFSSIGELMLLRQICGMAKVQWTADYAEVTASESEHSKIAIGIHHHSVRDALAFQLAHLGVLKLSGEDSAERKDWIMTKWEHSSEQILVINSLAGGVGMDFHYCDNILVLERQWSAADEEQFEFRFYNPDKSIKDRPTSVEYVIAKGTIDEWFYDLVEEKRKIFGETLGTNWSLNDDPSSFKDLIRQTVSNRL